jgi:hypothetical protein
LATVGEIVLSMLRRPKAAGVVGYWGFGLRGTMGLVEGIY